MTGADYKRIRESLGLSQSQLAKKLDLHTQTISKREREDRNIPVEAGIALHLIWLRAHYDIPEVIL